MHVLIVLHSIVLSSILLYCLLCTWPTPTVLLEYTQLQLAIDTDCYLHACEQLHAVKYDASSVHEAPAITLVL